MQYANLIVSIADKIAVVTFNRPGDLNATNSAMCKDIASACGELNANGLHLALHADGATCWTRNRAVRRSSLLDSGFARACARRNDKLSIGA